VNRLFIFGLGYAAKHIASAFTASGWEVLSTGREGSMAFDDAASVRLALADCRHVLSSVPPVSDGDPVLNTYAGLLGGKWLGYLSSTGVYGDAGGAWVDESTPIRGRRAARNDADADWLARGARVFRLPGIYGPGRSILERVRAGQAHRIDLPDQVFSRVHVDDIAFGVMASLNAPSGAYNLTDDQPCAQTMLVEWACAALSLPLPPLLSLEDANLSSAARAFYAENRRVANGKAKRVLGWQPLYPTWREGLASLHDA
jgi:nucleoside-diphosphate-sugar epimerase